MPKTIVLMAAQRNQKSAAGVMYLPSAGRRSSGIFGVVGVETKLKYHSNPIHITPLITCSQRTRNCQKVVSTMTPVCAQWMSRTMSASMTPATTTLRRLEKNAAMSKNLPRWVSKSGASLAHFRKGRAATSPRLAPRSCAPGFPPQGAQHPPASGPTVRGKYDWRALLLVFSRMGTRRRKGGDKRNGQGRNESSGD